MEPRVVLIAVATAISAWCLARAIVRQPRPLAARLQPYTAGIRARLGTVQPDTAQIDKPGRPGVALVFGPFVSTLADGLARLIDASSSTSAELRLHHAGLHLTVEQYRTRQLVYTAVATGGGALTGLVIGGRAGTVILLAAATGAWGATRWRAKLDRLTTKRRDRMRAELYTVCQLLAVYIRTGDSPASAVDRLVQRSRGEVIAELAAASSQIRTGSTPAEVFEGLTASTPEPWAARLYRLLSSSWPAGGDAEALLALADDLRAARREEISRLMAKRATAMALPLVMVIGPILILFVAAAIPHIVFGR
jgi:tight adherence protein C